MHIEDSNSNARQKPNAFIEPSPTLRKGRETGSRYRKRAKELEVRKLHRDRKARWSSFTSSLVPSQWTQRALRPFCVQREEQELDTVHYTPAFSESLRRIHGETALEVPSLTSWPQRFGLLTKARMMDCERSWFEAPLWNSIAVTWKFDTHRGTDDPARLTIQGILQPAARTQVQADSARVGGWVLSPVGHVPVEWDHVVSSLRASMTLTSST